MIKYKLLGSSSIDQYLEHFVETLLPTNRTYEYYLDWKKIKTNIDRHITEISLLDSLIHVKPTERKDRLTELIHKYPEVVKIIPIIIAIREKNFTVLEISNELLFKKFDFSNKFINQKKLFPSDNKEYIDLIVDFCEKSGIFNVFDSIKDLYTYLIGVEVGLDTNARKNRSGKIFEQIVGLYVQKEVKKLGLRYKLICEDSSIILGKSKVIDFVIYKDNKPYIAIECNFYKWSGGKGIEVAGSYADLQRRFNEKELTFIWITDGPGWAGMRNTLISAFKDVDYLLNFKIFEKNFTKIVAEINRNTYIMNNGS